LWQAPQFVERYPSTARVRPSGAAMRGGASTSSGRTGASSRSSVSVFSVNIPGASGSACGANGSRSDESCNAVKPRISVRTLSWHARQSSTAGML
jgi:hypothetical protein